MKKKIAAVLMSALVLLSGCSASGKETEKTGNLKITVTVYPVYDWMRQIIGEEEGIELNLLMKNGTDLHNFQPSAADMVSISESDMFVYIGGESDEWVQDALKEAVNKNQKAVNLISELGDLAKIEETAEGMQAEEEEEEEAYDEHIWLSVKNAQVLSAKLSEVLSELKPDSKDVFADNTRNYIIKLKALDEKYRTAVISGEYDTLIFADRFPFRYMMDDYGVDYYAAFPGCSAETEASFETVRFLSERARKLKLKHLVITETGDDKIANTIIENSRIRNMDILTMNSMQAADSSEERSYLEIMEENMDVLGKALK